MSEHTTRFVATVSLYHRLSGNLRTRAAIQARGSNAYEVIEPAGGSSPRLRETSGLLDNSVNNNVN